MTLILVKKFYKNSGKKPARIIFYRDGVSEGQFAEVSVREILAVKRACAKIDPNYKPPITYVSPRTVVFDSAANVQKSRSFAESAITFASSPTTSRTTMLPPVPSSSTS
jgi:hypothetical protein